MILVIDNYDSFTWNLVHALRGLGAEVAVARNDEISVTDALSSGAAGLLISPGPGRPEQAGISLELVAACAAIGRPLLGVCLGHQAIACHFGGRIIAAPRIVHGKTAAIAHRGASLFAGLPSPFAATRYHSLAVDPDGFPSCLCVTATAADGTIQGLAHAALPIHGVQFHPESIASEYGPALLANFLRLTEATGPSLHDAKAPRLVA
jgi:anthranilate synthase component 2